MENSKRKDVYRSGNACFKTKGDIIFVCLETFLDNEFVMRGIF